MTDKEKYGWGGTHSIWTGKFLVAVVIMMLFVSGSELVIGKVLFGWNVYAMGAFLVFWDLIVFIWVARPALALGRKTRDTKPEVSMGHGRATIPFGKWKGCRIRLLPNDYLS